MRRPALAFGGRPDLRRERGGILSPFDGCSVELSGPSPPPPSRPHPTHEHPSARPHRPQGLRPEFRRLPHRRRLPSPPTRRRGSERSTRRSTSGSTSSTPRRTTATPSPRPSSGKALKGVRRDRYILGTKVGQYKPGEFDFLGRAGDPPAAWTKARPDGVDYVDLLQCHDIEFADLNQIVDETLPGPRQAPGPGPDRAHRDHRAPAQDFPAVIDRAGPEVVEVILSFCHYELNDSSLDRHVLPYCRERNIGVINAAPTGMGLLTDRGVPDWHPAPKPISAGAPRNSAGPRASTSSSSPSSIRSAIRARDDPLIGTANPENIRKNVWAYAESPVDFELMARVLGSPGPSRTTTSPEAGPGDPILG